jgi:acyl carrier protein
MDTKKELKDFILKELLDKDDLDELDDDQDLLISGLVDSLGVVRMVNFIEQSMDIHVPPEDVTLENFQTVQNITNYLSQRNGI